MFYSIVRIGTIFIYLLGNRTKPMLKKSRYLIAIIVFTVLQSCSGTKKYAKQALKFEAAGMYQDAAKNYLESLRRDQNNIEARIGLKKTGEKVFQDRLDNFFTAKAVGDNRKAIYDYIEAQKYKETLSRYNIIVEQPSYMERDFEVLKSEYLEKRYNEGKMLMGQEKYGEAKSIFKEVIELDPEYKDVTNLKQIAYIEPFYQKALAAYAEESYVKAYYLLDNVVSEDPNYKDTKSLRAECLELGMYTIAILGIDNVTGDNILGHKIQASLVTNLANNTNPFIKVIDRENMESIIEQQRLNLSGAIDENTAAKVGELLGAKAVISGKIIERSLTTGSTRTFNRNGYQAYSVKQFNKASQKEETVTKYNKVAYKEYYQMNEVKLAYQMQVTSLETGEIIFSRLFDQANSDAMHFAIYDGDGRYLYPEVKGAVSLNRNEKSNLNNLLSASREVKASTELMDELLSSSTSYFSEDIIRSVNGYISK